MTERELPARSKSFLEAVCDENDLDTIIRAGTYFEAYLLELVELNFINRGIVKWANIQFQQKLELAVALGEVPRELIRPLRKFAEVRNAFAHRLDHKVDDTSLAALRGTFTGKYLEQFHGYAALKLPLSDRAIQLRAALLVIEQNLVWAAERTPSRAIGLIKRETVRIKVEGIGALLSDDLDSEQK